MKLTEQNGQSQERICKLCSNFLPTKKHKFYCSESCRSKGVCGENNPNYKGGHISDSGYLKVRLPSHPRANSAGYVRKHILVAEDKYGFSIPETMVVHHSNGDKLDNRPENLELIESRSLHHKLHSKTTFKRNKLGQFIN